MGVAIVLAYIALNLLSPAEILPFMAAFRPALMLALMSIPLAFLARMRKPELSRLRVQFVLVLLFYGWALGSYLPHGRLGHNLDTLLEFSPNVIAYFVVLFVLTSPVHFSMLRAVLVFVAIFVLINAFWSLPSAQASGISSPYVLADPGLGGHLGRIRGLGMLNDPNVFGQFLLMIMPMLYVSKKATGLGIGYLFAVPITVLFLIGVYFTHSRGAEMGVAVLVARLLIRRFKFPGAVLSGLFAMAYLIFVNAIQSRSITMKGGMDRLAIWSDGMSYFKHSPIWGVGFGEFPHLQHMTAHNSFLLCAAELGFVGLFLWMSIIVVTMIQLSRVPKVVAKSNPVVARWAEALRLSLILYLFTGFFLSRTYELPLYMLFGVSGAIVASAGGDDAVPPGTGWPIWSAVLGVAVLTLIYTMLRLRVV